jgi:hypothetical protein
MQFELAFEDVYLIDLVGYGAGAEVLGIGTNNYEDSMWGVCLLPPLFPIEPVA